MTSFILLLKVTFASLSYQIQNAKTKGYTEIFETILKSISPEQALRAYLVPKSNLNLTSLTNILRQHLRESNSFELFTALNNAKQIISESTCKFEIRLLSLRQKISCVSKQNSHSFSNKFSQGEFLHFVLTSLKNENTRNELKKFLKERVLEDKKLLEHLTSAMTDINKRQQKFSNTPRKTKRIAFVLK